MGGEDVLLKGEGKKTERRRRVVEAEERKRSSDDEVCFFFLKFSKFKQTVKVRKKMSVRADHICKTPPGWKKGGLNYRAVVLNQENGHRLYVSVKCGMG